MYFDLSLLNVGNQCNDEKKINCSLMNFYINYQIKLFAIFLHFYKAVKAEKKDHSVGYLFIKH